MPSYVSSSLMCKYSLYQDSMVWVVGYTAWQPVKGLFMPVPATNSLATASAIGVNVRGCLLNMVCLPVIIVSAWISWSERQITGGWAAA